MTSYMLMMVMLGSCSCFLIPPIDQRNFLDLLSEKERSTIDETKLTRMRSIFNKMILDMLSEFETKHFCYIIHDFLKQSLVDYKKFKYKLPLEISRRKDKCKGRKSYLFEKDKIDPTQFVEVFNLTTHIYNSFQLMSQCQVLTEATSLYYTYYHKDGDNHFFNRKYFLQEIRQKDPAKARIYFGRAADLIRDFENMLLVGGDSMTFNSSSLCIRLLQGERAFFKKIWFRIRHYGNTSTGYDADGAISYTIPYIIHNFGFKNEIEYEIDDRFGTRVRYFSQYQSWNMSGTHHDILVRYFPYIGFGKPISGHFVLDSLYNYGRKQFLRNFNLDMIFHPFFGEMDYATFDFPNYLGDFFRSSDVTRQCLYIHIISGYTNVTRKMAISLLKLFKLKTSDMRACLPHKSMPPRSNFKKRTGRKKDVSKVSKPETIITEITTKMKVKQRVDDKKSPLNLFNRRLTNMEIIMIIALSLVVVLSTLFFSICAVYFRRKQNQKGRVVHIIPTGPSSGLQPYNLDYANDSTLLRKNRKQGSDVLLIQDENTSSAGDRQSLDKLSFFGSQSSSIKTESNASFPTSSTNSQSSSFERTLLRKHLSSCSVTKQINYSNTLANSQINDSNSHPNNVKPSSEDTTTVKENIDENTQLKTSLTKNGASCRDDNNINGEVNDVSPDSIYPTLQHLQEHDISLENFSLLHEKETHL